MLDTRSNTPVVPAWEEVDGRPKVRTKPSFGLGSLRSHKRLLAISTIAFLIVGLLYAAYRPAKYTASSQLLVYIRQIQTGADLAILPGRADLPLVQNQIEVLRSGNVLMKTVDTLGLDKDTELAGVYARPEAPEKASDTALPAHGEDAARSAAFDTLRHKLSVRQIGTSHIIAVSYRASDPAKAALVVNTVIRFYLQELVRSSDAGSPTLRELYQSLGPSAFLISDAQPPLRPDGIPALWIAAGAALLGLLFGAAIAVLRDAMNDTIRSVPQVEHALGLECLGVIRRRTDGGAVAGGTAVQRVCPSEHPELRRLSATMLEAAMPDVRTLGVTSAMPGEGTTTLSLALARAAAATGKRVLLVEGASDRPVSRRTTKSIALVRPGDGPRSGLLDDVVEDRMGLHVVALREPSVGDVYAIDPVALDGLREETAGLYDLVVVDMPALATGPDVRAAARSLDAFLLVVKWGATQSELIRQALRSTGEAQSKFVGAVLNMADDNMMRCYGYELTPELKFAPAP